MIPKNTVVFFQTKLEGPNIQLNFEKSVLFKKQTLDNKEMKKELAVVLNKMIIVSEYFYEVYEELGLIKDYNVLFFLIFNNFPIKDITEVIKKYIDIFIELGYVSFPFTIKPIYLNSSADLINKELRKEEERKRRDEEERKNRKNVTEKIRKKLEERTKLNKLNTSLNNQSSKKEMIECDNKVKNLANKFKQLIEKKVIIKYFEPIAYSYELINEIRNYAFKVKIDEQSYIHFNAKGKSEDNMEINEITLNKKLFDPL